MFPESFKVLLVLDGQTLEATRILHQVLINRGFTTVSQRALLRRLITAGLAHASHVVSPEEHEAAVRQLTANNGKVAVPKAHVEELDELPVEANVNPDISAAVAAGLAVEQLELFPAEEFSAPAIESAPTEGEAAGYSSVV